MIHSWLTVFENYRNVQGSVKEGREEITGLVYLIPLVSVELSYVLHSLLILGLWFSGVVEMFRKEREKEENKLFFLFDISCLPSWSCTLTVLTFGRISSVSCKVAIQYWLTIFGGHRIVKKMEEGRKKRNYCVYLIFLVRDEWVPQTLLILVVAFQVSVVKV